MLKLKNVSKYYYNKGVVASGFTKVNLDLDIGEFVVITGESGSGKSTLLNVISGLDTYEDGEMYINGEETSHYNESDFEEYRKKYIGNIFQHFNLVNSYTVYQNIELVLLLNGFKKKEIKNKVLDIIKKVDMEKFKRTKVSRLSGGQKQRVAIARALAKDSSIIVADEPTGNLDQEASKSVLKLLHEISKDKLVVVVTHNYEQIEKYATRKIKMSDGKILEDKHIKKIDSDIKAVPMEYKDMKFGTELRIGFRNTFNIKTKFVLLFAVFLFIVLSITAEYSSFQKRKFYDTSLGFNQFFSMDDRRIILKKKDKTAFTESDYENIKKIPNIFEVVENDLLLDTNISLTDNKNLYYYGKMRNIETFTEELTYGRMPENDTEVIISTYENDYYLSEEPDSTLASDFILRSDLSFYSNNGLNVRVVGFYLEEADMFSENITTVYGTKKTVSEMSKQTNIASSNIVLTINNKKYENNMFRVVGNAKVPKGEAYVSQDLRSSCKNYRCLNTKINIEFNDLYFTDSYTPKITKEYTKNNFKALLGLKEFDEYMGVIFISNEDLNILFDKGNFQSSVFVDNVYKIDDTVNSLSNDYTTLKIKDALVRPYMEDATALADIFQVVFIAILTVALFFLSYFIIKLILKSRNIYFSTIRILGSSKKVAKRLLDIELFSVLNIAYLIFLTFVILIKNKILDIAMIKDLTEFLTIRDYIIVYVVLMLMSYLISNRFARQLFKKSAMNTYREEV